MEDDEFVSFFMEWGLEKQPATLCTASVFQLQSETVNFLEPIFVLNALNLLFEELSRCVADGNWSSKFTRSGIKFILRDTLLHMFGSSCLSPISADFSSKLLLSK